MENSCLLLFEWFSAIFGFISLTFSLFVCSRLFLGSEWTMNDLLQLNNNHNKNQNANPDNESSKFALNTNNLNNLIENSDNNEQVCSNLTDNNKSSTINNDSSKIISDNVVSNSATLAASVDTSKKVFSMNSNHHKRPSNTNENTSKRVKNEVNVAVITSPVAGGRLLTKPQSPQLLQQLMAPSNQTQQQQQIQQQKQRAKEQQGRWTTNSQSTNGNGPNKSIPLQQQSSNSVLMNLLVSGCDVSAGYTCFPRPTKVAKA